MNKNFEAERDVPLRTTLIRQLATRTGETSVLYVPDKSWDEFVAFVRDLDTERRVRRWVREEQAAIRAEEQAACDHARSAKLVDAPTGLLRCDDCGAEFSYSDVEGGAPSPERLEEDKAEAAKAMGKLAGGPPKG